jgi:2-polyprenyl-6-methoxyphenol hydroxylase-like FAD-dependent oxidoreductase
MAIEDAACLGLVFSKQHFQGDIRESLEIYEQARKPRATRVQEASARARENIYERIGMSSPARTINYGWLIILAQDSPVMLPTAGTPLRMRPRSLPLTK